MDFEQAAGIDQAANEAPHVERDPLAGRDQCTQVDRLRVTRRNVRGLALPVRGQERQVAPHAGQRFILALHKDVPDA